MRLRWRAHTAGTPAYKYIYFFSPPPPQRGEELRCQDVWRPPRHMSKIAALHGFGLK